MPGASRAQGGKGTAAAAQAPLLKRGVGNLTPAELGMRPITHSGKWRGWKVAFLPALGILVTKDPKSGGCPQRRLKRICILGLHYFATLSYTIHTALTDVNFPAPPSGGWNSPQAQEELAGTALKLD